MSYKTLKELQNSIKTKLDPETFYYDFGNEIPPLAIAGSLFTREKIKNDSSLVDHICKLSKNYHLKRILFKQSDGTWIDIYKAISRGHNLSIIDSLEYARSIISDIYKVSNIQLKEVEFIDSEKELWMINKDDGNNHQRIPFIDLNNKRIYRTEFKLINMENQLESRSHLCDDLELSITDIKNSSNIKEITNSLIWINGVFCNPTYYYNNDEIINKNKIMIKNGKQFAKIKKFIDNEDPNDIELKNGNTATITSKSEKRVFYDFDTRIFKWKNVKISKWLDPDYIEFDEIVGSHKPDGVRKQLIIIRYPKILIFNKEFNPDSVLLMANGVIVDSSYYRISNNRRIYLFKIKEYIKELFNAILLENQSYFSIKNFVDNLDFKLVVFSSEDGSPVKIGKNRSLKKGIYDGNSVLFGKNSNMYDITIVDGTYERSSHIASFVINFPETIYFHKHNRDLTITKDDNTNTTSIKMYGTSNEHTLQTSDIYGLYLYK